MNYYILNEDKTVAEASQEEWLRWFAMHLHDRHVARTELEDTAVSTVFLGIDHNYSRSGPPLVFETMIFGGAHNEECWRHSTWDEAMAGHKQAVSLAFRN